jgi:hypothetical protein
MKTGDLMIRCLALKEDEQWVAICLPYDLAAQGNTLPEVKGKLEAQIRDYLEDALVGPDREHADYLLHRRAPARYWLLYWFAGLVNTLRDIKKYETPVPLVPAAC